MAVSQTEASLDEKPRLGMVLVSKYHNYNGRVLQ